MSKLNSLKDLIHSLTKSEKRYFKMFLKMTSGGDGGKQMVLFRQIQGLVEEGRENLSEAELKVFGKGFGTVQMRLYQSILKSQRVLYAGRSVDGKLCQALEEIAFLVGKNKFVAADRILAKAEKLAEKFGRFGLLQTLLNWKRNILLLNPPQNSGAKLMSIQDAMAKALAKSTLLMRLRYLEGRLRLGLQQELHSRKTESRSEFQKIVDDPSIADGISSSQFIVRALALHIRGLYFVETGETETAYRLYESLIADWNQRPDFATDQAELFLHTLSSYLVAAWYYGVEPSELKGTMEFARALPISDSALKLRITRMSYQKELILQMNSGRFETCVALIAEIDAWLDSNADHLPASNLLAFYHNFVTVFFFLDELSTANRYLLKILQLPGKDDREDVRSFARIFQLILQLELGAYDLAEYLSRSTRRYLKKNALLLDFERVVLRYIHARMATGEVETDDKDLVLLAAELEALLPDDWSEVQFLGMQMVSMWIESKHRGISIREVFREKRMEEGNR